MEVFLDVEGEPLEVMNSYAIEGLEKETYCQVLSINKDSITLAFPHNNHKTISKGKWVETGLQGRFKKQMDFLDARGDPLVVGQYYEYLDVEEDEFYKVQCTAIGRDCIVFDFNIQFSFTYWNDMLMRFSFLPLEK